MTVSLVNTAETPLPENWDKNNHFEKMLMDGWSHQSNFASTYPSRFELLKRASEIISTMKIVDIRKRQAYSAAMINHARLSWLTAAQIFLLGKNTEVYPVIRVSIEAASLAFSFIQEPKLVEHWINATSDDQQIAKTAQKALKKGTYQDAMHPRLQKAGEEILTEYERISHACNKFGSHANPSAVISRYVPMNDRICIVATPIDTTYQAYLFLTLVTAAALIFDLASVCADKVDLETENKMREIVEELKADVTSPETEKFTSEYNAAVAKAAENMKTRKF